MSLNAKCLNCGLAYKMNDSQKSSAVSTAKLKKVTKKSKSESRIRYPRKPPEIECRICGQNATGIHYGVVTCEGCKGFFRRCQSSTKELMKCENKGKCRINKLTRTHCPHCRLQKCLAAGMSTSCLRVGRYSKRQREKNEMEARRMKASRREDLEKKDEKIYELIQSSLSAHKHTTVTQASDPLRLSDPESLNESTDDVISVTNLDAYITSMDILNEKDEDFTLFDNASIPILTIEDPSLSSLLSPENGTLVKTFLLEVLTPAIFGIVQYAKYLQEFLELTQEDQMSLLKGGFFEMWVIREFENFIKHSVDEDNITVQVGGQSFHKSELVGHKILGDLFVAVFSFSRKISNLDMPSSETALLCTTILFSPDRRGVSDKVKVGRVQDSYVECLAREMGRRDWRNKHILAKCLLLMTELRSISHLYRLKLKKFMENELEFEIPFVLMETLDYDL